jgi:glycosyltransferase involved in cell wall biosynthesis
MIKLSIIIPVYNVEKYIRACLNSVFNQGLSEDDFEVIIVNDGTRDKSMEAIDDFVAQHHNIMIVNQENKGLSVARNNGIERANGEYIYMLDSDDLLIGDRLKSILDTALNSKADIIMGDYVELSTEELEFLPQSSINGLPNGKDKMRIWKNGIGYYCNFVEEPRYVWRYLFKKDFLQNNYLRFIPGLYFEDIPFMVMCLLCECILVKVPVCFYIYRQHSQSIVHTLNKKKLIDLNIVMSILWHLKDNSKYSISIKRQLIDTLFYVFTNYKWRIILNANIYSERHAIIDDLRIRIPDLKFTNGIKQLVTTLMLRSMPYKFFEIQKMAINILWRIRK